MVDLDSQIPPVKFNANISIRVDMRAERLILEFLYNTVYANYWSTKYRHVFFHNILTKHLSALKFHRHNQKNMGFHLISKFWALPGKCIASGDEANSDRDILL